MNKEQKKLWRRSKNHRAAVLMSEDFEEMAWEFDVREDSAADLAHAIIDLGPDAYFRLMDNLKNPDTVYEVFADIMEQLPDDWRSKYQH